MPTENVFPEWPGWTTLRIIGQGSFGTVYEIERDLLGEVEKAALKVITIPQNENDINEMLSEGFDGETITRTFQSFLKNIVAEYSLMRKMNGSTNVVNCDDIRYVQHDDGIGWDIFIKMELLTPLTHALPKQIDPEMVLHVGIDICKALVLCSKYGIIHRDIKPLNIFLSPDGDYKLGDFGVAKMVEKTSRGTKVGTYKYMAPEIYNNQPYGMNSDLYSLGLVMYWMLNERRMPFLPLPPEKITVAMDENARLMRMQGAKILPPKNGNEPLKRVVLKACAHNAKERFNSAMDMLEALQHIQNASNPADLSDSPTMFDSQTTKNVQTASWHPNANDSFRTQQTSLLQNLRKTPFRWVIPVLLVAVVTALAIYMIGQDSPPQLSEVDLPKDGVVILLPDSSKPVNTPLPQDENTTAPTQTTNEVESGSLDSDENVNITENDVSNENEHQNVAIKISDEQLSKEAAKAYLEVVNQISKDYAYDIEKYMERRIAMLYDLNGDGQLELMVNEENRLIDDDLWHCISVYSYENGRLITRLKTEPVGRPVGSCFGYVMIANMDSTPALVKFRYESDGYPAKNSEETYTIYGSNIEPKAVLVCTESTGKETVYLKNKKKISKAEYERELGQLAITDDSYIFYAKSPTFDELIMQLEERAGIK